MAARGQFRSTARPGVDLAAHDHQTRGWAARPALQLAAAAIFAVAGAGIAWQATTDDRELAAGYRETLDVADGQYFAAALVTDDTGTEVGHVFLYDGDPSWVFAVLGPEPAPGDYDVVVQIGDGVSTIATCEVEAGGCGGGAVIGARISAIQEVRLVGPDGTWFTAELARGRSAK